MIEKITVDGQSLLSWAVVRSAIEWTDEQWAEFSNRPNGPLNVELTIDGIPASFRKIVQGLKDTLEQRAQEHAALMLLEKSADLVRTLDGLKASIRERIAQDFPQAEV